MSVTDEPVRGSRRFNLIDALLALILLGLIPLAYSVYVFFKTPLPTVTKIEPASFAANSRPRIVVTGTDLRPYMRLSLGTYQGLNFLFGNTTQAQVDFGDLPPGTYDVVLYDFQQERVRLPKAVTVVPAPIPESKVIAVGSFGNLNADRAAQLTAGTTVPGFGEVIQVGKPTPQNIRLVAGRDTVEVPAGDVLQLPALVRVDCGMKTEDGMPFCTAAGTVLLPTKLFFLSTPLGSLPFQVDQIRSVRPLETILVTLRANGPRAVLSQVGRDDVHVGSSLNQLAAEGRVVDLSAEQPGDPTVRDVKLRLQAQRTAAGWVFAGDAIRLGAPFVFRTARYEIPGLVISLNVADSAPAEAR